MENGQNELWGYTTPKPLEHAIPPEQTLIYVMTLPIFMLHLFAGNSSNGGLDTPHGYQSPLQFARTLLLVRRLQYTMKRSGGSYSSHCEAQKKKDSPDGESLPLVLFAEMTLLEKPTGRGFQWIQYYLHHFHFICINRKICPQEGDESSSFPTSRALPLFHSTLPGQAGGLVMVKRWEQEGIILTPFWQLAILSQK